MPITYRHDVSLHSRLVSKYLSLQNFSSKSRNGGKAWKRNLYYKTFFLNFPIILLISIFFKKWANHGLFFVYFQSFQTNNTIFITNQCQKLSKCPSSIRFWDLNPQPFKHESSPITTTPGLPPLIFIFSIFLLSVKNDL